MYRRLFRDLLKPPALVVCLCAAVTTPLEKGIPVMPGKVRYSVKYRHHADIAARKTGMIGAHNSKTNVVVVVPVGRIVVVPGRTTQILRFVVPRTAAQSFGRSAISHFQWKNSISSRNQPDFLIHPPSIRPSSARLRLPNS
jgi:hypothetical protein